MSAQIQEGLGLLVNIRSEKAENGWVLFCLRALAFLDVIQGFLDALEAEFDLVEVFFEFDDILLDFCGFAFAFDDVQYEVAEIFAVAFTHTASGDILESYAEA